METYAIDNDEQINNAAQQFKNTTNELIFLRESI